ncbi:SEL1-like repeat protein [Dyella sp. LX-66]|uniref:SEL1-like repeat protein n=1 Tax=unclassified Dyella TaxID=2634549 RepID=UPI001BE0C3F4|nr:MULTISPECIES: SEL1-like repeat protein [unclassified Dyella]MBT2119565.1 SEL1-like repeat protein [Dyella sp. LX-1]MBT2141719.1 SEL1-like repeat protein [Dyella sp. LX-66]
MKAKISLAIVMLIAILAGSAHAQQKTLEKAVMTNQEFALDASQIRLNEEKALDGTQEAANRLAHHYEFVAVDLDKALRWYEIAAENGSTEAMYNYWTMATQSNDPNDGRRGLFWLKKAASLGDTQSKKALQDLKVH